MSESLTIQNLKAKLHQKFSSELLSNSDFHYILEKITGLNKSEFHTKEIKVSSKQTIEIEKIFSRVSTGEPIAYIFNESFFRNLTLYVDSGVLIPRCETEILVDLALDHLKEIKAPRVVDLCSGSGCVGFSIASECPKSHVDLWEVSKPALKVTKKNHSKLGLKNAEVKECDVLQKSSWSNHVFDCVVVNPPYIAVDDPDLCADVQSSEPGIALYAENNGLEFYQNFASNLKNHLSKNGKFFAEMGWKQSSLVAQIFESKGWEVVLHFDYSGHARFIEAKK